MNISKKLVEQSYTYQSDIDQIQRSMASSMEISQLYEKMRPSKESLKTGAILWFIAFLLFVIFCAVIYIIGIFVMFLIYYRVEKQRGDRFSYKRLLIKTFLWPYTVVRENRKSGVNYS